MSRLFRSFIRACERSSILWTFNVDNLLDMSVWVHSTLLRLPKVHSKLKISVKELTVIICLFELRVQSYGPRITNSYEEFRWQVPWPAVAEGASVYCF